MVNLILVALGGALGASLRYAVALALAGQGSGPWVTFAINLVGSAALGMLWAALSRWHPQAGTEWHLLLGVGLLGGFTTMSSFALDVLLLARAGQWAQAVVLAVATPAASILCAALAVWLVMRTPTVA